MVSEMLPLDPTDRGKHLKLEFDGIATHSTIWATAIEQRHERLGEHWTRRIAASIPRRAFAIYRTSFTPRAQM